MPDPGNLLSIAWSIAMAAAIHVAAFGFGRPLWRLIGGETHGRLTNAVHSLLIGFPVAGVPIAVAGVLGELGAVAVCLITLAGILLAGIELACTLADLRSRQGWRLRRVLFRLQPRHAEIRLLGLIAAVGLGACLVISLAPPTGEALQASTLAAANNAVAGGTFWSPDGSSLAIPSPAVVWYAWGLALDGPVAANLIMCQFALIASLGTVLLARPWLTGRMTWCAGLLTLLSFTPIWGGAACNALVPWSFLIVGLLLAVVTARQSNSVLGALYVFGSLVALVVASPTTVADSPVGPRMLSPLLVVGLGGLVVGTTGQRRVACGLLAAVLLAALLDGSNWLLASLVPFAAVAAAAGATILLRLTTPYRHVLALAVGILIAVQISNLMREAAPRLAVATGWQSRESFLLASAGSYRAAVVFNEIRRPGNRLLSTVSEGLYFAAPTEVAAAYRDARKDDGLHTLAYAQGYDYLLLADPVSPQEKAAGASGAVGGPATIANAEKFAGAVEVIPIVEYEFADEYQRTTRYRLWKLQGRRAAVSPELESARSGEEVSSRPRPLVR